MEKYNLHNNVYESDSSSLCYDCGAEFALLENDNDINWNNPPETIEMHCPDCGSRYAILRLVEI